MLPSPQALPLIQELLTDPVLASGHQALDKVPAVSISSQYRSQQHRLIRSWCEDTGSRKLGFSGGYNVPLAMNPFNSWATVLDCGDIPVTS